LLVPVSSPDREGSRCQYYQSEPGHRFNDSDICQEIFDETVEQGIRAGLIDGTVLYSDNSHLKAQ